SVNGRWACRRSRNERTSRGGYPAEERAGPQRPGVTPRAGNVTSTPQYPPARGLLEGKTVLVTAAAGTGIGFATAKRCVEEGARVAITDIHERRLNESAAELGVMGIVANVTAEDDVQRAVDAVVTEFGSLDV